jgi:hypothetical protein
MRYFKNSDQIFAVQMGQEDIIQPDWVELSEGELASALSPTKTQARMGRIADLKQLLSDSDYKVAPDYDRPNEAVRAQRAAWRAELRSLQEG